MTLGLMMARRSDGSRRVKEGRGSAEILYWRGICGGARGSEGGGVGARLLVGVGGRGRGMGGGNGLRRGTSGV